MSGHNKWSQIKHKKAKTDGQKSKIFSKHASFIAMESRKAHGDLGSPGLIAAIDRAKKDSMPKDNIDRAVAKGSGAEGSTLSEVLYETYGPGGVAILITAVTDNPNRTTPEVKHLLSKLGYQLGTTGSSAWAFTKTHTGYSPNAPVTLSDTDGEKLGNLIEALETNDDLLDIFTTADEVSLDQ
ncbi:MAG: YebC/PmpR family DNA-binding transcriptional regulator [Candidatus Pacebacteria bacterium]|nr:YebC/PmpR family DNA-binding transcriptional regulator [Candidatus Paceibacterota bacterium]